jgi:hypothetical protein
MAFSPPVMPNACRAKVAALKSGGADEGLVNGLDTPEP